MKMTIEEVRRGMAGSDFDIDKKNHAVRIPEQTPDAHYEAASEEAQVETNWSVRFPNISLWIVEFQDRYADLPPYVWTLCKVFLSKSQAIAFAKDLKNNANDIRIRCQKNLRQPKVVYKVLDNGSVEKIKEA